jgi:hypothetical protein
MSWPEVGGGFVFVWEALKIKKELKTKDKPGSSKVGWTVTDQSSCARRASGKAMEKSER